MIYTLYLCVRTPACSGLDSGVAQWKRAGLITQRSVDRNYPPLLIFLFGTRVSTKLYSTLCVFVLISPLSITLGVVRRRSPGRDQHLVAVYFVSPSIRTGIQKHQSELDCIHLVLVHFQFAEDKKTGTVFNVHKDIEKVGIYAHLHNLVVVDLHILCIHMG